MSDTDYNDASSALLSLATTGAPVLSDNDAPPASNVPAKTNKQTEAKQPKPASSPKTVPEVATTNKEEATTAANDDNQESLTDRAARHLDAANSIMIPEESAAPPDVASPVPDPPKGWDREVESILESKQEQDTSSSDVKPAPNKKSNQDENKTAAVETNGGGNETMKDAAAAAQGEKRRVCSKSVGSATGSRRTRKVSGKSTLKGNTLSGTWTAAEANEKKRKASEPKKPPPEKKKRPKKPSASPAAAPRAARAPAAAAPRKGPKEVYSGPPQATDVLKDGAPWPAGWTKKKFKRMSGSVKKTPDPYWYSPIENKKLRSMNEVNRFMDALKKSNGDELKAWDIFKKKK